MLKFLLITLFVMPNQYIFYLYKCYVYNRFKMKFWVNTAFTISGRRGGNIVPRPGYSHAGNKSVFKNDKHYFRLTQSKYRIASLSCNGFLIANK